jgi:GNAT superfamily N-acetyltransferase
MPEIRVITTDDIPAAIRLKDAASWNQTELDWYNLIGLSPEGCFGIEVDGALVATTTAVCFGPELAWIGMVLTHPDHRGRGLARALMERALAWLDGRVDWIKLDATDMGRPLYRKLGFEDECPIERWAADPPRWSGGSLKPGKPDDAMDRTAFGADRDQLLATLATNDFMSTVEGYAMGRPGSKAAYFGPCVARTPEMARVLANWYMNRCGKKPVYWDLLPENRAAVKIAQDCGFQPLRKLMRMARPGKQPFAHDDSLVYAIAGFEFG